MPSIRGTLELAAIFGGEGQLTNSNRSFGQDGRGFGRCLGLTARETVMSRAARERLQAAVVSNDSTIRGSNDAAAAKPWRHGHTSKKPGHELPLPPCGTFWRRLPKSNAGPASLSSKQRLARAPHRSTRWSIEPIERLRSNTSAPRSTSSRPSIAPVNTQSRVSRPSNRSADWKVPRACIFRMTALVTARLGSTALRSYS